MAKPDMSINRTDLIKLNGQLVAVTHLILAQRAYEEVFGSTQTGAHKAVWMDRIVAEASRLFKLNGQYNVSDLVKFINSKKDS